MRYTYLMFDGEFCKIGYSNNPEQRLRGFKVAVPECKLICYGRGITESQLHTMFAKNRVKGEWFYLNFNDVAKITKLITDQNSEEIQVIQFSRWLDENWDKEGSTKSIFKLLRKAELKNKQKPNFINTSVIELIENKLQGWMDNAMMNLNK